MHVRSTTYKSLAFIWALLLMFNTSGLTMDMHFCQGKLKRVNLFGKAKTCAEMASCMKKCGKSEASKCSKDGDHKGCCNNESFELDQDVDAAFGIENHVSQITIAGSGLVNIQDLSFDIMYKKQGYNYYDPPPLIRRFHIVHQHFLL